MRARHTVECVSLFVFSDPATTGIYTRSPRDARPISSACGTGSLPGAGRELARMLGLLRRNPAFARLWLAMAVSQAGDWLSRVAVLSLIADLGGVQAVGPVGVLYGAELALRLLPTGFMAPLAGPVADRLSRRMVMVLADLARAAVVLCLLFVQEAVDLPLLYGLVALQTGLRT